jgi:hypothetical protein
MSPELLEKVLFQAQTSACHSWEYGTVFEALLEYHDPAISIFNDPFPGGQIPILTEEKVPALRYVKPFILTDSDQLCEGNGGFCFPTSIMKLGSTPRHYIFSLPRMNIVFSFVTYSSIGQ